MLQYKPRKAFNMSIFPQFFRSVSLFDIDKSCSGTELPQATSPIAKVSSPGISGSSTSNINGDMYIADGDYIKDIEVNDLRNRYTLTKGLTQKMVNYSCHTH
jgi:hypothetical protein